MSWRGKICHLCGEEIIYLRVHLRKHEGVSIEDFVSGQLHNGVIPKCACGCGQNVSFNRQLSVFNSMLHTHQTTEMLEEQSRKMSGANHPQFGKKKSKETKSKISKKIRAFRDNNPELVLKFNANLKHGNGYMSRLHQDFRKKLALDLLGFEPEQNVVTWRVDELHEQRNVVIEICGDYVHANPKMFQADDRIRGFGYTAQEKWDIDAKKWKGLRDAGYTLIIIWESDDLMVKEQEIKEALCV